MNDDIVPTNHSVFSATTTTASHAVGEGLKGGVKAALGWIITFAVIGAVVGLLASMGALAPILGFEVTKVAAAAAGKVTIGHILGATLAGGAVAGFVGAITSPLAGVLGGAFGIGKGTVEGSKQVQRERAASVELNTSLAAMQAQAMAQSAYPATNIYTAPSQENHITPPQGSRMNPALSSVDASSLMPDGKINERSLQLA